MGGSAWRLGPGRPQSAGALTLAILVTLGLWAGCHKGEEGHEAAASPQSASKAVTAADGSGRTSARDVLAAAINAYRQATTYSDQGRLYVKQVVDGRKDEQTVPFAVSMERPTRIRVEAYRTTIVCDGQKFRARIEGAGGQVLDKEAPRQLTLRTVYCDPVLSASINNEFAGGPPQLVLLLDENPLGILFQDTNEPKLLEPAKIDEHLCDRVAVPRPEGTSVFWIDRATHVLRRFEFPVDELRKQIEARGKVEELSITAEFSDATLDGLVTADRFEMEIPPGSELTKFLVPPEPGQLLGKKLPDYKFTDLEGHSVLPENLGGKIVVLKFWAVPCQPCRDTFPVLEKVYQKYKDNPKFAFRAVSVDPPSTDAAALREALQKFGSTIPILRDTDEVMQRVFLIYGIPATLILDHGVLQDFDVGVNPEFEKQLSDKLEQLALGRSIVENSQRLYQDRLKSFEKSATSRSDEAMQPPPRAKVAEASQPSHLTLKSLWRCRDVQSPSFVLPVPGDPAAKAPLKLYVIQQYKAIAEIDPDGRVAATHTPELPSSEVFAMLQTMVAPNGKRYFLGWAPFQQQVHVFDQEWKSVLHFPEEALEHRHAGITDALFAPAESGAMPDLIVAYWGSVGLQRVSFEGKRVWSNRSVENVFRTLWSDPKPNAQSAIECLTGANSLVAFDG